MPIKIKFVPDATPGPIALEHASDQWAVGIVTLKKDPAGKPARTKYSIEACACVGERANRFVKLSDGYFRSMSEAKQAWQKGFVTDPPDGPYPASPFIRKLLDDGHVEIIGRLA